MKKIKRMLAFMFKKELMELLDIHMLPNKSFQFVERSIEFSTMKMELNVPVHIYENPHQYEIELQKAKQRMFIEVEKCMEVDSFPLIDSSQFGKRMVRIILRVQNPKIN